ncbi:MAG: YdcF family protein, partial [Burkholderiales bacterium]|nr:YdcF family protein [Burkholderiales bacterium]
LQNNFGVTNPILIEEQSRNTNENAKFVTNMIKELNYTDVVIVSQAFHSTRCLALFKRYGIDAIAAPTDYMGYHNRSITLANFIPDAGTLADCASLLHEVIGYFAYITLDIDD